MNYDEIVEALRYCSEGECNLCPYDKYGSKCSYKLMADTLDLIKEQHTALGNLGKSRVEWIEIGKELGRKETNRRTE